MMFTTWEKRVIECLLDFGYFNNIADLCKKQKVDYANGKKYFPKVIKKLEKSGEIILKNGHYELGSLGFNDSSIKDSYVLAFKNNRQLFFDIISKKRYTFAEWINKVQEMNEYFQKNQKGYIKGINSIIPKLISNKG